jgi:hypothetical protein
MGQLAKHYTRGLRAAGGKPAVRTDLAEFKHDRAYQAAQKRLLRLSRLRRAALLLYCLAVGAGCFGYQYWGCFCHDPLHGHPNEWNMIATAEHTAVPHECSESFPVARLLGIDWCCAVGGGVAAHFYVTAPIVVWIWRCYGRGFALLTLVQGGAVASGLAALLIYGVAGLDPPPGHGLSGVPLGAAYMAGLGAWLVFSLAAFRGYWVNEVLGRTMRLAVLYVVASGCAAVYFSFAVHVWLGPALFLNLLCVAIWATQVKLTSGSRKYALLAYLAPLGVGVGLGAPLEMLASGMPPVAGVAIGNAACFLTVLGLSTVYERRGLVGAAFLALFLFAQDAVVLAFFASGAGMDWVSGAVLALALESVIVSSILVARREGHAFALWAGSLYALVLGGFTLFLVDGYGLEWPTALAISAAIVAMLTVGVTLGFYRSSVAGMQ